MKMIVAVGAIEFKKELSRIFQESGIRIYSQSRISGHNEEDDEALRGNWFAQSSGEQHSIMFFAFTEESHALQALGLVKAYNESIASKSRLRAFIMPVEIHN